MCIANCNSLLFFWCRTPHYFAFNVHLECASDVQEKKILMYACRNCDYKMAADNNCIYVNKLMHEIDELRHINPEVITVN